MIIKSKFVYQIFILFTILCLSFLGYGETEIPKAKYPILTTSAGQSADVNTVNVVMEEAEIPFDYCDVPSLDLFKKGVGLGGEASKSTGFHVEIHTDLDKYSKGTPYQSIIFAIGASLKGMGASGLTVNDEIKRLKSIIDYCHQKKIFIIAVHVGGGSKRGATGSDNERMIDAVAPFADYIVAVADSNKDGRFSKIAKDKGIPYTEIKYALGLVDIMKKVFQ